MSNIFTIPAGIPFSKALAAQLLKENQETPEELADILILLPTRRACRTLRDAFLQENEGKPIILPTLQAIGDIDEEELSLSIMATNTQDDFLNLPPTLPTIQRRVMLARAIIKHKDFPYGFDQALNLAKALGQLLDQIYTENLDIKNLADLVPEDFANHWQVTLDFLKILSDVWPDILNDLSVIDAANRRNQLINTLNNFWQKNPPKRRIIAAGTTGSIPAVAHLLKTISNLPNGQIILPGLDQHIDDDSWKTIEEAHPQYGFKHLLNIMDAKRKHVKIWPSPINDNTIAKERRIMACELMRPAETSKEWQNLKDNAFKKAIENLKILECETSQNEA
ncbi:MAG: double-strand break repair protein AddB, partial [Bdellovibrionales bacterium]